MKTTQNELSVTTFIQSVEHPVRQADAEVLLNLYSEITGLTPKMWGTSIVGYGKYHYKYDSGREGDMCMAGFSPRKQNLTLYMIGGWEAVNPFLEQLGKHKTSRGCLYINKLADVNLDILKQLLTAQVQHMKSKYPD